MFLKLLACFFIILSGICSGITSDVHYRLVSDIYISGVPDSLKTKSNSKVKVKTKEKKPVSFDNIKTPKLHENKKKTNSNEEKNNKNILKSKKDTIQKKDIKISKTDSLVIKNDSIDKKSRSDSLRNAMIQNNNSQEQDSVNKEQDTIAKKVSPNAVDEPIKYNASDSIRFEVATQKVYLFGNAFIKYKDIELKAAYIELSLGEDLVFAKGVKDTSGKEIGKPEFKETDQSFNAVEITYNFKTKKGLIKNVITKPDGNYLHSERAKKMGDDVICIQNGKFTTCDQENPHFYIALTKAKVIPESKIVSGPAYLVISDVPFPLGIPFGFFPNKKGNQSGIIIPQYGEELNRGFFLKNGGYYFAINDYVDLTLKGDIYSNGTWASNIATNYRKLYKFNGNIGLTLNENFAGEKGDAGYSHSKLYSFIWTHTQDPKSRPNSTFSANVNASSSSYDKYNSDVFTGNQFTNTKSSSIRYTKNFPNSPFNFSASMLHSQNSITKSVMLTLPNLDLGMSTIYPLRKKVREGQLKWYENIGFSYSSSFENKVTVEDSLLFTNQTLERFQNGVEHHIPVGTTIKAFKYFTISPKVNFDDLWYFNSIKKSVIDSMGTLKVDTVAGFNNVYSYNLSTSFGTTVYGMYQFKNSSVQAIRHVITPTISLNYKPSFGAKKYGYFDSTMSVRRHSAGEPNDTTFIRYSRFENGIKGTPSFDKSGTINLSLDNNLEMKVKSKNDTSDTAKKVKIFDQLFFNTSYDVAKKTEKWSSVNMRASTMLFKIINLTANGSMNLYALDSVKNKGYTTINTFEWKMNHKIGRLTTSTVSIGANIGSTSEIFNSKVVSTPGTPDNKSEKFNPDGYLVFRMPWSLNIQYNIMYNKPYIDKTITQSLSLSGNLDLTSKWKIGFSTSYDFIVKKFATASVNIHRDLHCWEMSFNWVPFGPYQSYTFKINVKATMLQDLKLERRKDWQDNLGS